MKRSSVALGSSLVDVEEQAGVGFHVELIVPLGLADLFLQNTVAVHGDVGNDLVFLAVEFGLINAMRVAKLGNIVSALAFFSLIEFTQERLLVSGDSNQANWWNCGLLLLVIPQRSRWWTRWSWWQTSLTHHLLLEMPGRRWLPPVAIARSPEELESAFVMVKQQQIKYNVPLKQKKQREAMVERKLCE